MTLDEYHPYAGVGARETPKDVRNFMTNFARQMELHDYTLRSGAADGADNAFEKGVTSRMMKEIFLPWKQFNDNNSLFYLEALFRLHPELHERVERIAREHHPKWSACSSGGRKMHMRNVLQVTGIQVETKDEVLSEFMLCWTLDGKASGGTGQAIRVARHFGIPVYNLRNQSDRLALYGRLNWSGALITDLQAEATGAK